MSNKLTMAFTLGMILGLVVGWICASARKPPTQGYLHTSKFIQPVGIKAPARMKGVGSE